MSEASYQRSLGLGSRTEAPPLQRGYGLLVAVAVALGLWAGIIWALLRILA